MQLDIKTNKEVVEKISKLLKERGIKQKDFSDKLGWKQSKLSKVLKYQQVLTFDMYLDMCKALGVEPQEMHTISKEYLELRNDKGEWVGIIKKTELK